MDTVFAVALVCAFLAARRMFRHLRQRIALRKLKRAGRFSMSNPEQGGM